jgi:DNA invertase Pin-like site-specific DNA recombinase
MRLIGYVRVSRVAGREGPSFISTEVQRERIKGMATAHGHTVVDWEQDLDQPGSRYERRGFQAALAAVEAREADGIAVARLDRFARSVKDAARAIERLETAGGALVAVDLNMDTSTSGGRLMRNVLMALAEFENERVRENWASAGSHFAARGGHVCRVAPVGYRKNEDTKLLEPDPIAAPVIRELFQRRAAGEPWNALCNFLDERLPRENGDHWPRSTVTSLISSRTYLGEARGGGIINGDAHLPLVTRGEFEAAQASKADGRHERGPDGGALLTGLLRCGSCGHTLTRLSDGSRGYANYKCRKRHRDGICEAPVGISVSRTDSYVEREFLAMVERDPIAASGAPADGTLDQAAGALEAAERELSEYQSANLISVIGRDAFVEGVTQKQRAVDVARRNLAEASATSPLEGIHDLQELWPSLSVRERRHLLGSVLDSAVVSAAPGAGRGTPVENRLSLTWR